jgi:hypothetical protein
MTELSKNTQTPQCDKTTVMESVILPNELRFGIYLQELTSNDVFQVEKDFFTLLELNLECSRPIPLTEEWLLKCKSNSIFNNGFEYKKTRTGRFEIYVGMSLITVIEFVHELQNLNFALLGEDLVFENV